jgi:hypothetical protein
MDEIVGDGIHEESDEKGRYAPMYDQKGKLSAFCYLKQI